MEHYGNHCQPSLFYENHDNPRMVSKVDPDPKFRDVLAKLLAVMQLTLRGTPFLFQGQELGMVNKKFTSIHDLRDVESLNLYKELCETMSEEEAYQKILAGTRDHARTPMQWTNGENAGFSKAEPWIPTDEDCKVCNAEAETADKNSVLHFYQALIALRKAHSALTYGSIEIVNKKEPDLFTYYRKNKDETLYIECALSREGKKRKGRLPDGVRLLSNYPEASEQQLRPYEAAVWQIKE
jgi:oligo-1,6-glucosidase